MAIVSSIFTVAYEPNLSNEIKEWIKDNITESMESTDGESKQYAVDQILDNTEIFTLAEGNENDVAILRFLREENVSYVELTT